MVFRSVIITDSLTFVGGMECIFLFMTYLNNLTPGHSSGFILETIVSCCLLMLQHDSS